jgi:hypothetical protein
MAHEILEIQLLIFSIPLMVKTITHFEKRFGPKSHQEKFLTIKKIMVHEIC